MIRHFLAQHASDATVVSFDATSESDTAQRERFAALLAAAGISAPSVSWSDLLGAALGHRGELPTVVSIGDVPRLIDVAPEWLTVLQHEWDRARGATGGPAPFLILTGSTVATMNSIISAGGVLYERPTQVIRLEPLTLPESHELLRCPDPVASIEAFAACGGYPLLLNRWNTGESTQHNLIRLAGDTFGALAAHASSLLLDLPDAPGRRRVLAAIARGAHKYAEITAQAGRPDRPLAMLESAGLIRRGPRR